MDACAADSRWWGALVAGPASRVQSLRTRRKVRRWASRALRLCSRPYAIAARSNEGERLTFGWRPYRMTGARSVAFVLVLVALAGCSAGAVAPMPASTPTLPASASNWSRISDGPLSARNGATAVWTGREVLIFGGDRSYCPPESVCDHEPGPALRDGAAYDPAADSWRPIAAAPMPIRSASAVLVNRTLYALVVAGPSVPAGQLFLTYDLDADEWRRLPAPDRSAYSLAAIGDLLVASRQYTGTGVDDWTWDPDARTWRGLPDSPNQPWDLRQVVDLDGTGILLGQARIEGSKRFQGYLSAHRLDPRTRTWSQLTSPEQESRPAVDGSPWHVLDGLAVMASVLEDRFAGTGPFGGFVHPREGWSPLPARPRILDRSEERLPWATAAGGGYVVAGRFALHVETRTWQELAALPELSGLGGAPAVAWAGDRLFVWGGQQDPDTPMRGGWTWRPRA